MKVFLLCCLFSLSGFAQSLKSLPIQDGGRIKPFETFAREHLELVYGKNSYEGKVAEDIILTWLLQPSEWESQKIFEVRFADLKKALKLPETEKLFSLEQIQSSPRLTFVLQELQSVREKKEKLNPYFQAVQKLESQLNVFHAIATGEMIRVMPPREGTNWFSLPQLSEEQQLAFLNITNMFIKKIAAESSSASLPEAQKNLDEAVQKFMSLARAQNPALYPSDQAIGIEVFYNDFHPFRWAWMSYLLAAILIISAWVLSAKSSLLLKMAWVFAIIGFLLHLSGFFLRIYIAERPPVSNMYETVIWVGFGAMLFSMVIELFYKMRFVLLAGTLTATLCLVLGDMAPVVLDPSLQPLEAVLRSNYWLIIHVMTISISYAAFFLAFTLGDIGLFYYLKGEAQNKEKIHQITVAIYRCIQVGVSFLAPGIILGGIWADYSWGRFWGWDPKETWALIVLLGYIAVIHAKMAGLLKDFGLICVAVIAFSLVIMAWYGVNFVLGAGLHSYGFGAGGVEYVTGFVLLHIAFVLLVYLKKSGQQAT